jgi:hypothetical protein
MEKQYLDTMGETLEREQCARQGSYGLLEGHNGMERGVVDGDDEKEMFFELCSKVYGGEYVKVYVSPAVQPDGRGD